MSAQTKTLKLPQPGSAALHGHASAIGNRLAALLATRQTGVIAACAAILVALVWSSTLAQVEIDRQETMENLRRSDANLTRVVAEHTAHTLKSADQVLLLVKRQFETHNGRFEIGDYARAMVVGRVFKQLGAVDEHGSLLMGSVAGFMHADMSRDEQFRMHAAGDTGAMHVGKPVKALAAGTWSVQLTRRINKADGSFGGVVMIAVDPQYFSRVYGELDLGPDGVAILVGTDAIVRAREEAGTATAGQDISGSLLSEHMRLGDAGSFRQVSQGESATRYTSYRKLAEYPLAVAVSRREAEVFRQFDGRGQWYFTAGVIASLLILAYSILAVRLNRRPGSVQGGAAGSAQAA